MTCESRLIIVDGIMGSGKSTTVRYLHKFLTDLDMPAIGINENVGPHPLRLDGPMARAVGPEKFAEMCINKWGEFVCEARKSNVIQILDGQLFHGSFTNLFLINASEEILRNYVSSVCSIIECLSPLLVYFYQKDVDKAIRIVCEQRGDDWVAYQTNWKLNEPYCLAKGFIGSSGLSELYQDYRAITDVMYEAVTFNKLAIENSAGDWQLYYRQIQEMLIPVAGLISPSTPCNSIS